jgi:hypothetical protein
VIYWLLNLNKSNAHNIINHYDKSKDHKLSKEEFKKMKTDIEKHYVKNLSKLKKYEKEYLEKVCEFDKEVSEEDLLKLYQSYAFKLEFEKKWKKEFSMTPTGDVQEFRIVNKMIESFRKNLYTIKDFEWFLNQIDNPKEFINSDFIRIYLKKLTNFNQSLFETGYYTHDTSMFIIYQNGVPINPPIYFPTGSILHYAIYDNNLEMIDFLLKNGAGIFFTLKIQTH